jgi:uncharacterized membrane protein YuzA (DUF378 family)
MQGWKRTALIAATSLLLAAMMATWVLVDLDRADAIASVIGAGAGLVGLAYALVGGRDAPTVLKATQTGNAASTGGGEANTGVRRKTATGLVEASAENTGDANADGAGGHANTGVSTE